MNTHLNYQCCPRTNDSKQSKKWWKKYLIYFQRWNSSQNQCATLSASLFDKCATKSCSIPWNSQVFILARAHAPRTQCFSATACVCLCPVDRFMLHAIKSVKSLYTVQTHCCCYITTAFVPFVFFTIIQLALSIHWLPHIYTECFHSDILQYFSFFLSSIFRFRANSLAKAHWNVQKKWCYSLFIHWWRFSEQKKCENREKPPNAMAKKTECT